MDKDGQVYFDADADEIPVEDAERLIRAQLDLAQIREEIEEKLRERQERAGIPPVRGAEEEIAPVSDDKERRLDEMSAAGDTR